jgi:GxxExxY protein
MEIEELNDLSYRIIGAGVEVHRALGPGLLESTYRTCLVYELRERRLNVVTEHVIPIRYKSLILDGGYRIDLIVEDTLGLLMNFNVAVLTNGVDRIKNRY